MAQKTYIARKGQDADFGALTATTVTINGTPILATSFLAGSGDVVDLNGEAGGLILDAAAAVVLQGATAGHAKLDISGGTVIDATSAGVAITGTESVSGILTATGGIKSPVVTISGDGAITITPNTTVVLSKGSAAAITLAAPTNTTHDGYIVRVVAISAQAHVITGSVRGFNAKASSGTATFGGAKGDSVTFVAMGGDWFTLSKVNVTIA